MKKYILLLCLIVVSFIQGCRKDNDYIISHRFKNHSWYRFNILQFEIPLKASPKGWDIYFFANHLKDYPFDNLDFHMIMTTPSGEERIKTYNFLIKRKDGGFTGDCGHDSCMVQIPLKKEIYLPAEGVLKIQIETLVPRIEIKGLLSVGIRMHPRV